MHKHKALAIIATPIMATALMLMSSSPAISMSTNDSQSQSETPAKSYIIVNSAGGIASKSGATFYPTGPISDDTLIVIAEPDGSLPGGITETQLNGLLAQKGTNGFSSAANSLGFTVAGGPAQAKAGSDDIKLPPASAGAHAYAGYSASSWSQQWQGGSVIGTNTSAKATYKWNVIAGSSQINAARVLGYYKGYNGSQFGLWSNWYSVGSADADKDGIGVVPWGNVAANTKFMTKCAKTPTCGGKFTP